LAHKAKEYEDKITELRHQFSEFLKQRIEEEIALQQKEKRVELEAQRRRLREEYDSHLNEALFKLSQENQKKAAERLAVLHQMKAQVAAQANTFKLYEEHLKKSTQTHKISLALFEFTECTKKRKPFVHELSKFCNCCY
jgi:hypothetical protein